MPRPHPTATIALLLTILIAGCTVAQSSETVQDDDRLYVPMDDPPGEQLNPGTCLTRDVPVNTTPRPIYTACINEDGFRGPEYSTTPPEDTHRIIALGDYLTFGMVDDGQSWPAQLQDLLNDQQDGDTRYQVLNMGFPSWNTEREVAMLNTTGVRYDPDLVVVQFMENDAQDLDWIDQWQDTHPDGTLEQAWELERGRRFNSSSHREELEDVNDAFRSLEELSGRHGFDVVVMYYATADGIPDALMERYLDEINATTDDHGWTFFQLDLGDRTGQPDSSFVHEGTWELTAAGHSRTAEVVAGELREHGHLPP